MILHAVFVVVASGEGMFFWRCGLHLSLFNEVSGLPLLLEAILKGFQRKPWHQTLGYFVQNSFSMKAPTEIQINEITAPEERIFQAS